jgi:CRP-like cAMP-binding protein
MSGTDLARLLILQAACSTDLTEALLMTGSADKPNPLENRILAALPREEQDRLRALLEPVTLTRSQVLYEREGPLNYAYFPQSSLVSLVSWTEEGAQLEVGLVGNEGMVGLPVLLGGKRALHRAIVQVPDGALRMRVDKLRAEFKRGGPLSDLLLGYTHYVLGQTTQSAICNRFHNTEERLCRWLLMARDSLGSKTLPLTQEFLAQMLGARRPGVTITAGLLQSAGLIRYRRGHITITDPEGLESAACECYRILKEQSDGFLNT